MTRIGLAVHHIREDLVDRADRFPDEQVAALGIERDIKDSRVSVRVDDKPDQWR